MLLCLSLFLFLFNLSDTTMFPPQCRERFRALTGDIFGASYANYEIPMDSKQVMGDSFPFICPDFPTKQRYGWLMAGAYNEGEFLPSYCSSGCIHQVTFEGPIKCGIRRPPIEWSPSTGSLFWTTNCEDLNIPMMNQSYSQQSILGVSGGITQETLDYLVAKPWKGLMVFNVYDQKNAATVSLQYLINNIPTLEELYVFNSKFSEGQDITFLLNVTTSKEWKVISYEGVALPESIVYKASSLKALRLYQAQMKSVPSWVKDAKSLQYLQIDNNNFAPLTGLENFANLPLEHLFLPRCGLTSVNGSLVTTSNLLSLDLSCNTIEELPDGFFQPTPNLLFLSLLGNALGSLSAKLLAPLTQLRTLDIGRQFPPKFSWAAGGSLYYFNRISPKQICRPTSNDLAEPRISDFSPSNLPKPENLLVFEMILQNGFNLTANFFTPFKNLKALNIGNLNLVTLDGLGLETLTNLNALRASGNLLTDENWLPDDMVLNLHKLQIIYITSSPIKYAPSSMIALAQTQAVASSQFTGDLQQTADEKTTMNYCDYNVLMHVLVTTPLNDTCSEMATEILSTANDLVTTKYTNQQIAYPMTFK